MTYCGDGIINNAEVCDGILPESAPAGAECTYECELAYCGDSVINATGEECDSTLAPELLAMGYTCEACKIVGPECQRQNQL